MREKDGYSPSDEALKALARRLYPAIRAYFESEAGQREFAEWKAQNDNAVQPNSTGSVELELKAT